MCGFTGINKIKSLYDMFKRHYYHDKRDFTFYAPSVFSDVDDMLDRLNELIEVSTLALEELRLAQKYYPNYNVDLQLVRKLEEVLNKCT